MSEIIKIIECGGGRHELRVGDKFVAAFNHDVEEDLATCLRHAANAADEQRRLQAIEIYFKMFNSCYD